MMGKGCETGAKITTIRSWGCANAHMVNGDWWLVKLYKPQLDSDFGISSHSLV
jgi:hypothetical protein